MYSPKKKARKEPRRNVFKDGKIVSHQLHGAVDVRVRNLSESGALVEVPLGTLIPVPFEYLIVSTGMLSPASTRWRKGDKMDIEFTGPPKFGTAYEDDQYGRLIARCSTDGFPDIGASLVTAGYAWAFIKYSTDYTALEKFPRAKRIGIWQSKTQPPWEYRARRWDTATKLASEGCPVKGNINATGERIDHAPWSRHYMRTVVEPSKGERWFCSEAEARAAGWRAPYR